MQRIELLLALGLRVLALLDEYRHDVRRELLLDERLDPRLDLHTERIARLAETQSDGHLLGIGGDAVHHSAVDQILLRLGVSNLSQYISNFVFHTLCKNTFSRKRR